MTDLSFTVPMVAPSVNHYVKHTRQGRHYVTAEALAFKKFVAIEARRRTVVAKLYQVDIKVFLGPKQKGDVDNFGKVCLDSLVDAGVITSDAKVMALSLSKDRDVTNPRTEFRVRAL